VKCDKLPSFQSVGVKVIAGLLKSRHGMSAVFAHSNMLVLILFFGWKRESRRSTEAVVAFAIGGIEHEAPFSDFAEILDSIHDGLLRMQKVANEVFSALESCRDLIQRQGRLNQYSE
jgi:hypothetical protein